MRAREKSRRYADREIEREGKAKSGKEMKRERG